MQIGPDGDVWCAAPDGLARFENGRWVDYPLTVPWALPGTHFQFAPANQGVVLVAVPEVVFAYSSLTRTVDVVRRSSDSAIGRFSGIARGKEGFWITGEGGLARVQYRGPKGESVWEPHSGPDSRFRFLEMPQAGDSGEVLAITADRANADRFAISFRGGSWRRAGKVAPAVSQVWRGPAGELWARDSLRLYREREGRLAPVEPTGILASTILDVNLHPDGSFWVSTSHGVARYSLPVWRRDFTMPPFQESVFGITEDAAGRLWFAGRDSALLRAGGRWITYSYPKSFVAAFSRGVAVVRGRGLAMVAVARDALLVISPDARSGSLVRHPAARIFQHISSREDGNVWVETLDSEGAYLESYDGQNFRTILHLGMDPERGSVRSVVESGGDIWLASNTRLDTYRRGARVTAEAEPPFRGAFSLHRLADGSLLAGAARNVWGYDGSQWTIQLANVEVGRSIAQDQEGRVWLAANSGLYRQTQAGWILNTEEDGLPSTQVLAVYRSTDGAIWAGTTKGPARYDPDRDKDPPRTLIGGQDNVSEVGSSGDARISFSGIDKWKQTDASRLAYSHRLDGGRWSQFLPDTKASFSRLAGGRHSFQVRAMDRNGNIDPAPAEFHFRVAAPWHRHPGFLLTAGLGLATLVVLTTISVLNYRRRGELVKQLKVLAAVVQSTGDAVVAMTPGGEIRAWNRGAEKLYQYSAAEMIGQPVHVLSPETRKEETFGITKRVSLGEHIENHETEHRRKDGTIVEVAITASPVMDEAGAITGISSISRDITERRAAEMTAERQRLRMEGIVNSAMDGIITIDEDRRIVVFNAAAETMFRRKAEDALGESVDEFIPERFRGGHQAHIRQFGEAAVTTREMGRLGPISGRRADGEEFPMEASISQIEFGGHKLFTVTLRDTERARADAERQRLEMQLRESQKMEAIGQLSGGIAHDFNNILTVIQGHVSLMESDDHLPREVRDSLQEIALSSERAASLTRQLLAFSRRQAMQASDLDLRKVVDEVASMLKRVLGEHIHLEIRAPLAPLVIHADRGMMEQVLLNLALNSRDAMPNGGSLIIETCSVNLDMDKASPAPGGRQGAFARLTVSDDGCGIPADILPRIFEPFMTTKSVGKGTGLGLATVYGIVQQHDGWIEAESEVGKGTVIRAHLPRLEKPAGASSAVSRSKPEPCGAETILVVEDEATVRALVERILSRHGYRVLVAPSGPAAMRLWRQHSKEVRLLLTDLVMPDGMSGLELARRLRAEDSTLKVIYTSGYSAEIAGREVPLEEGVNFLAKPYDSSRLAKAVRSSLES